MKVPVNLAGKDFNQNKHEYFAWLRDEAPVYKGRFYAMPACFLSRHQDCADMLRDDRFVRNRATATGKGGRFPFPMPKRIQVIANSMIQEDNPEHRRLRLLVNKAFTPKSLKSMEGTIDELTDRLLDALELNAGSGGRIDLMQTYALPIPVNIISRMMGATDAEIPQIQSGIRIGQYLVGRPSPSRRRKDRVRRASLRGNSEKYCESGPLYQVHRC